ncbi:dual specificity protein phosphatase PHS1 isoform X2 [Tanacetum coccineum]
MATANHALEDAFRSAIKRCRPRVIRALQKDRRSTSVNSRMSTDDSNLATKSSNVSNLIESPLLLEKTLKRQVTIDRIITDFDIVAIDFGVPRKPTSRFRAALMDLQGFHIFLLTLHQELDSLLKGFVNILRKTSSGDFDKEDLMELESQSHSAPYAQLNKELEQWNELLKTKTVKLCQENNFNSWFLEGNESNAVVDAHELKLRLEHILERISLISDAGNTEKPSSVTSFLFIGGALAARSVYTLQHIGITHILCLCSNEIGQSDSQRQDLFEHQNFSIFEEAHQFIDAVEHKGGKLLVHCFEGRSRSARVVLAYLMMRKKYTLQKAWNTLRRVHRRAQPNDGFATVLLELDRKLHGNVSMEWQQKKPSMKVCPVCGKTAGLSSSSLKLHLQKAHKKLSSGSVDSAMTMEMQKVLEALNIAPRQSHTMD